MKKDQTEPKTASLFKTIAEASLNSIALFETTSGKCVYLNKSAKTSFNWNKKSSSLNLEDLFSNGFQDGVDRFDRHLCNANQHFNQIYLRKPKGPLFMVELKVSVIEKDARKFTVLVFQDISAVKQMDRMLSTKQHEIFRLYQEALEHKRNLEEIDIAKQNFMMLAAHELRTPLSSIIGTADILVRGLFDTDEQRDTMINIIHKEGVHLLNILTDTLDYLQLQSGQIDLYIEKANLEDLTRKQIQLFVEQASQKEVELDLKIGRGILDAYVDPRRYRQVINNLVDNAIQFSQKKSKVTILLEDAGANVRVSVQDRGPGMTPDQASDVYSRHLTIENALTHRQGTGLGMGYTKKIIESLGGRISFFTSVGVGTIFTVDLPKEKVLEADLYRCRAETVDDIAS